MTMLRTITAFLMALSSITPVFPTAISLFVYIGPNDRLIFLVAEHHEYPIPQGYDRAIIAKVLDLLQDAESTEGGYHILIEGAPHAGGHDLLGELIKHAPKFKKSILEDIEIRKVSGGATTLFNEINENIAYHYHNRDKARPEILSQLESFADEFGCDIGTATFVDVFTEIEGHIKLAYEKNDQRKVKNRSQYGVIFDIRRSIAAYKELLHKHGFKETDSYMDVAVELKKKYPYDVYHKVLREFNEELHEIAANAMDLVTYERMMDLCENPASKPLIVITGAGHTSNLTDFLRDNGYLRAYHLAHQPTVHEGKRIYHPLSVEDFDVLKLPLEHFKALLPEPQPYTCILL